MCAHYSNGRVRGNKCWLCIPGSVFDDKETIYVQEAERRIRATVDENLSNTSVRIANFFFMNYIVTKIRSNIPDGVEKAQELIPGTIVKLLNYSLCIFFLFMVPITALALCFYYDFFGFNYELWVRICFMVVFYVVGFILIGTTIAKYGKNRIESYMSSIEKVVRKL